MRIAGEARRTLDKCLYAMVKSPVKTKQQSEWIWPPADLWLTFWCWWVIAIIGIVTSKLFFFFRALTGSEWICCYVLALVLWTESSVTYCKSHAAKAVVG